MPDGTGYVVLDKFGGVYKYGSALPGPGRRGLDAVLGYRPGPRHHHRRPRSASRSGTTCSTRGVASTGTAGSPARTQPVGSAVPRPLAGDHHLRREAVAAPQRRHHPAHELIPVARLRSLDGPRARRRERSTSPRSILWNASSTSSSAIVSLTKRSRSSRPCEVQVDEHREVAGRQAVAVPRGLSAPPRPKNSIIGSSIVIVGSGTPTCTTVPARSRA